METHVYINDREACSKAADGKSSAAFPDPCWSPPSPSAGPVLIPYPNTAFARDLQNGTSTVFICGTPVAQRDVSFLANSTGNEPATQAFNKGTKTGVIKGKAYFKSWSPNVKFEGLEVARHEDLMTHNHGSNPGNTPPNIYVDTKSGKGPCGKEVEAVAKHCKPEKEQEKDKDKESKKASRSKLSKIISSDKLKKLKNSSNKIKEKIGYKRNTQNDWIEDHCDGLMFRPWSPDQIANDFKNDPELLENLQNLTKDMEGQIKGIVSDIDKYFTELLKQAQDKATQALIDKLEKKLATKLASQGVKAVGKGLFATVPVAGWIISGLWTAYDIYDIYDSIDELNKLKELFETTKELIQDNEKVIEELSEFMGGMSKKSPYQIVASGMSVMSRLNACTRARRCLMVRYDNTKSYKDSFDGKGCCPGQTGHHLIPEAMAKSACSPYQHDQAPVICVEGINQHQGSHKTAHDRLDKQLEGFKGDSIKYDPTARNAAVKSFQEAFPESKCRKECLEAQLDFFYKKCTGSMTANSGKGGSSSTGDTDK